MVMLRTAKKFFQSTKAKHNQNLRALPLTVLEIRAKPEKNEPERV